MLQLLLVRDLLPWMIQHMSMYTATSCLRCNLLWQQQQHHVRAPLCVAGQHTTASVCGWPTKAQRASTRYQVAWIKNSSNCASAPNKQGAVAGRTCCCCYTTCCCCYTPAAASGVQLMSHQAACGILFRCLLCELCMLYFVQGLHSSAPC